jgi:hypothetical protein
MKRKSVAEILDQHVTFELEAIDRMYLNGYVPSLQSGGGVVYFMKEHLGARVPSTTMVAPLSQRFVEAIERFAAAHGVDVVTFEKGQRKDDVAHQYLATFTGDEGVLFIKFCSYFPYAMKVCLNGHAWLKRRSTRGSASGFAACRIPSRPRIAAPAIAISSRSSRRNSP